MKLMVILFTILVLLMSGCRSDPDAGRYASIAEGRAVNVPAMTGGKILQLNVDAGDPVESGQVLAIIDTTELHLQRNLIQAQFNELAVQASLAANAVDQGKRQFQYISERQQRINQLFEEKSTSRQALDDINNQLEQSRLALEQARQNSLTVAAKQGQLQAQLQLLDKKTTDAVIQAPGPGIISERFYEPGEAIPPLAALVEIINLNQIEIKIYISEMQLPQVKTGQAARVHIDGDFPAIDGTVSWISPTAEFTPKSVLTAENRTSLVFAVKIIVENPDGVIKHGMPVTVGLM